MYELSLFTGGGGGVLGTSLLGWQPRGYVEWNTYCQKLIAARIKDGYLANAPIFGDIRAFIHDGYAGRYRGMVDVITGGFPCQPFSVAGKRAGEDDARNMWPATIETISLVRPPIVWLENVSALQSPVSRRIIVHEIQECLFGGRVRHRTEVVAKFPSYFGRVLSDLDALGYRCRWDCIPASAVGANHRRDRVWIVAYDAHIAERQDLSQSHKRQTSKFRDSIEPGDLANSSIQRRRTESKIRLGVDGHLLGEAGRDESADQPATDYAGVANVSDAEGGEFHRSGHPRRGGVDLQTAIRMFPSPTVNDSKNNAAPSQWERNSMALNVVVSGNGGQLNPRWVDWLMGWPIGWSALKPLAMGRYRSWLRKHGLR